jgi:hypothetical protein
VSCPPSNAPSTRVSRVRACVPRRASSPLLRPRMQAACCSPASSASPCPPVQPTPFVLRSLRRQARPFGEPLRAQRQRSSACLVRPGPCSWHRGVGGWRGLGGAAHPPPSLRGPRAARAQASVRGYWKHGRGGGVEGDA